MLARGITTGTFSHQSLGQPVYACVCHANLSKDARVQNVAPQLKNVSVRILRRITIVLKETENPVGWVEAVGWVETRWDGLKPFPPRAFVVLSASCSVLGPRDPFSQYSCRRPRWLLNLVFKKFYNGIHTCVCSRLTSISPVRNWRMAPARRARAGFCKFSRKMFDRLPHGTVA